MLVPPWTREEPWSFVMIQMYAERSAREMWSHKKDVFKWGPKVTETHMGWNMATLSCAWWCVMIQLVFTARRDVYFWKEWKSKIKRAPAQLTAQLSLRASYLRCISSLCAWETWQERQRDRYHCQNYIATAVTSSSTLLYFVSFLLWAQWSLPQPLQWSPPAQFWLAVAGSPERGELPLGCLSEIRALAATGSGLSPDAWSPASAPHAPAQSKEENR